MALSLDRISTQLAKDLYQSTDQVRGACAGIIFKFKIGDMAALPASTNEKRARVNRDGNLHPTRGYPIRSAPLGTGFTRSIVLIGWGRVLF